MTGALVALVLTTGRGREGRARAGQQAAAAIGILVVLVVLTSIRTGQIQDMVPALLG